MTDKVTRLVVRADPSQAIQAADEAKKAWLEVDKITANLGGKGNVFGGQTAPGVTGPGGGGGAAPGSATSVPGGGGLHLVPGGGGAGGAGPQMFQPGGATQTPSGAPAAVPGAATLLGSGPSGTPAGGPPSGGGAPPSGGGSRGGRSIWTDLELQAFRSRDEDKERPGVTGNSIARAMQAASMMVRGGVAGPELAGLGMMGMGFNAWAARSKPGSIGSVVGSSLGGAIPILGSLIGAGAGLATQQSTELAEVEAQMGLAELYGVGGGAPRRRTPAQTAELERLRAQPPSSQRDAAIRRLEVDNMRWLGDRSTRSGYTAQEAAPMYQAYAAARGFEQDGDLTSRAVDHFARLGLDPSLAGRYQGLAAPGIGATGGNFASVAGMAWSQGLRGDRLTQYLSQIASNTESLAQKGIEVDQEAFERFLGRMQATPGLSGQGARQIQAASGLQSVAMSVADEIRAPWQNVATARFRARAYAQGGGLLGALEYASSGDLPEKVNTALGDGDVGTLARAAVTRLPVAQARALGNLAAESAGGSLPKLGEIPGLEKKKLWAEGDTWLKDLIGPEVFKKVRDRTFTASRTEISLFVDSLDALEAATNGFGASAAELGEALKAHLRAARPETDGILRGRR